MGMEKEITALQQIINQAVAFLVNYSFQVIGAILILIIGIIAAQWVSFVLLKIFEKKKLDVTLAKFVIGAIKITILCFAVLIALSKFGITIAPFIAALGAVSLGCAFAIQGPLSNYGAGLSIILGRPFVVGNTVSVAGVSGVVEEVKLAYTVLLTEDGVKITVPNKEIVGQILHNSGPNRIVEATVGISYENNPDDAIRIIRTALNRIKEVVKQPAPQAGIQSFADSAIEIGYRYWTPTDKYFQVLYVVNLAIYHDLRAADITIPYPQQEVHIVSSKEGK